MTLISRHLPEIRCMNFNLGGAFSTSVRRLGTDPVYVTLYCAMYCPILSFKHADSPCGRLYVAYTLRHGILTRSWD